MEGGGLNPPPGKDGDEKTGAVTDALAAAAKRDDSPVKRGESRGQKRLGSISVFSVPTSDFADLKKNSPIEAVTEATSPIGKKLRTLAEPLAEPAVLPGSKGVRRAGARGVAFVKPVQERGPHVQKR